MKLENAEIINQVEAAQVPLEGKSIFLQGELVRLLRLIHNEACENSNINASDELVKTTEFIEETLLETDLFDLDERMELRGRFDAIRETLRIAIAADKWGKEKFDEDEEDPTEIAIPVLVADEFYAPIFDFLGRYLKANTEPIKLADQLPSFVLR